MSTGSPGCGGAEARAAVWPGAGFLSGPLASRLDPAGPGPPRRPTSRPCGGRSADPRSQIWPPAAHCPGQPGGQPFSGGRAGGRAVGWASCSSSPSGVGRGPVFHFRGETPGPALPPGLPHLVSFLTLLRLRSLMAGDSGSFMGGKFSKL